MDDAEERWQEMFRELKEVTAAAASALITMPLALIEYHIIECVRNIPASMNEELRFMQRPFP